MDKTPALCAQGMTFFTACILRTQFCAMKSINGPDGRQLSNSKALAPVYCRLTYLLGGWVHRAFWAVHIYHACASDPLRPWKELDLVLSILRGDFILTIQTLRMRRSGDKWESAGARCQHHPRTATR